jgi:hypothetical protein
LLIKNPENISNGKNTGPMSPIVAFRLGVAIAKNDPKPTAVLAATTTIAVMEK